MTVTTDLAPRNSPNQMRRPARLALHAILILGTAIMVAPFLLMLLVSLLPLTAFMQRDFSLSALTLENYFETFRVVPFGRYYFNSIFVTVTVTVDKSPKTYPVEAATSAPELYQVS